MAGLGPGHVIDRYTDDVAGTAGRFDVIPDSPARVGLRDLQHLLTPDGVFVTTRPLGADAFRAMPARLRRRTRRWTAVMTSARSSDLAHLGGLVVRGDLHPNVDRSYPMADVADAHRHAEGPATGKVVLDIGAT